jgi:hypothetical protein
LAAGGGMSAARPLSPWRKIALGARIWYWYVRVRLRLRRHRLPAVIDWLGRQPPVAAAAPSPSSTGRRVARALSLPLSGAQCLSKSLVLLRFLHGQGLEPELVIGLPHSTLEPEAHAWIEVDGRDVGPPPGSTGCRPLARYAVGRPPVRS